MEEPRAAPRQRRRSITDLPDDVSLVALELVVNATGRVNSRSVKLLTPEDVDKATKKAVADHAPGG
jgi:uncharacterized protein with GYD domain